ncbi:MAG: adenylate/guanylate cyclase domain-containing protein [Syntrophobacteraceae bacterium]
MGLDKELEELRGALKDAGNLQAELDLRIFHMKTLYDVSMDLFSSVQSAEILKLFLMMTMGNFGVIEGFISLADPNSPEKQNSLIMGFDEAELSSLEDWLRNTWKGSGEETIENVSNSCLESTLLPVALAIPFCVGSDCSGVVGLGQKLAGDDYTQGDVELLVTLCNNLVVALKNARSFEEIRSLNDNLKAKNIELEDALRKLRAALRKVEILESVKSSLSKFVPHTVCRMIEESPTTDVFSNRDQDLSVLFLDVEGYTRICEKLDGAELNEVIEKYFSIFMDAIYENNGDVNETAGDGLMVIFHNEDRETNAREAVNAALSIRQRATCISRDCGTSQQLVINMGINSGTAMVGAARFESYTGSRWTYTARGSTTNIAARIGALAIGGSILLSRETADRVRNYFPVVSRGRFTLKNVSSEMEVFEVNEPGIEMARPR